MNLRYIGPFFRMNRISLEQIQHQLFFFSKEALNNIVLNSKCGIVHTTKSHKKHSDNTDDNIFSNYSPLVCVYKKGSPKPAAKNSLAWDEESFKKEVPAISNALMTLCILELSDHYSLYENNDEDLFKYSKIYKRLAKHQLEFYSTYLRNSLGVFVDKKINSTENIELSNKNEKFKYSDQAFMMNAYYLYWKLCPSDEDSLSYKDFSLDILKMLLDFKENLYELSFNESCKLCLALSTFYNYSENEDAKELLLNLMDLIKDNLNSGIFNMDNIESMSIYGINLYLLYNITNYHETKDDFLKISEKQISIYNPKNSLYIKNSDKKNISYPSSEIINYIVHGMLYYEISENSDLETIIPSIYRETMINGPLVSSWPKAPSIDSPERYRKCSLKSDEMLDENYFTVPNSPSFELTGLFPIFNKEVTYSKKKESFDSAKNTFYSEKNMMIYFIIILLFKKKITNTPNIDDIADIYE